MTSHNRWSRGVHFEWRISSPLSPPCARGARCRCLERESGTRLKHSPPALRTGAGIFRARDEKKVPARDRAAAATTPNRAHSECCAARTHPARSALPLRTFRRPLPCFTPSLSVCFCPQSLRVSQSWCRMPSRKVGTLRPAPAARFFAPPACRACSKPHAARNCQRAL